MPMVAALAGTSQPLTLSAALAPSSRRPSFSASASASDAATAPTQSTEAQPAPREFQYARANPSVRWPNLKLDDFSKPHFLLSPSPPLPAHSPLDDDSGGAELADAANVEPFEPFEGKQSRTQAKKMTKLALKRARDWRQRVQLLADRILALPPSAHVADVLDNRGGLQMTPTDLAFVVKVVGRSSWARALETFEWLTLRRSHAPGPRLLSIIISVLGRARQDSLAAEIFQRCCNPDGNGNGDGDGGQSVQVYNAMMGVYARTGKFFEVQESLAMMKDKGLEPDLVSFNTLINARAKAGVLAPGTALELLGEVRRSGLRPDTITYNTLISACSHGSNLEDAVRIFRDMEASRCQPDLWTYNAMISVFGRNGMAQDAVHLFHELSERGFSPDAVTYNSLLYAFAKEGDVDKVEKVCNDMLAAGFKKDEITYNTLIHMYGKQARLDLAVQLYEEMKAAGRHPDSVTYTVLIDSLGKANRIMDAGKIMSEMVNIGVRPTLRTFSALICGYAKAGMRVEAERTFNDMLRSGVKPDHLAYSVMLDIQLRSNDVRKAMSLYKRMIQDSFRPDQGIYQAIFSILAKAEDNEKIEGVIKDMQEVCMMSPQAVSTVLIKGGCFLQGANLLKKAVESGYEPDIENLLSLVEAYSASNKHAEALALLEYVQEHAPNSSCVTMEASIITLCKAHQLESAITEYNKMKMFNFAPFSRKCILYQCMITTFEENGLFSEASQLFSDMKFLGVKLSEAIYKSMISVYCKMGFPETAECLVDQAERTGVLFTDSSSYIYLIETYGKLKLWQRSEAFVRKLSQHSNIDKKIWNSLIYAYAESGLYEQARAVFNMMVKNGLSPTVDSINGLMHALIVDGRLDELFVVVEELQDMDFRICKSTILILLEAFAKAGNIFEVKKIYNSMKATGYLPTMNLYRIMISLFCRGKRVRDVESMVVEMKEAGFNPDLVIYNSLLKMYTKIEDFKKTVEVYQNMRQTGHEADEVTYNTLILMYSKDLRPEEGFTILNEMKKKGLEPRLDTYKSLLSACCKEQLWEQAEELFNSMRSLGYRLDRSFYHIMMKIYRNSGNHSKAENLLLSMEGEGIKPTVATMHLLMTSYGSAGQPHEAENVLNNLKASGLQLSTLPYISVIDAYLKAGDYNTGVTKLLEMKRDGLEPDNKIWTCFIRAASLCERTEETVFLLNSIANIGFDLPIRLLKERTDRLIWEVDHLLDELRPLADDSAFNLLNALEDLLWAFERRATASWLFKLAIQKCIYSHDVFRVAEKDWGADFRKLSGGAALVGLTLWLDHMQDASLQGSPESPKSVVLITGTAEYNLVSLSNTIKAYLWEMGSPFLPCKTRSGVLVAKAHSLRMWLKDSSFCLDLELKDAISLPKTNSMKLNEGYFMRAGLVPAFKDIHERLGQIRPKKFARLALLSDESRDKVIKADIEGRKEKLQKLNKKRAIRARRPTRLRTGKFMRRQHNAAAN